MKIAIFADIHGKMLLPFKLVDLYQQETGEQIDYIIQCGDMGAYPNLDNLDKATLKHAKDNPDELGFHEDFTVAKPAISSFLDKLDIPMFCVRGNHEDHDFLDELEQKHKEEAYFPIDPYEKVLVCKTGQVFTLTAGEESITLAGIGRIGDRKGRSNPRFIQAYEQKAIRKLIKNNPTLDLLITHDKDSSSLRGYGMQEIRNVLDELIVRYHFYGHTGEPYKEELDINGITTSIKIKELEFEPSGILPKACMVILEKKGLEKFHLTVIDQAFTNKLTQFNWTY